MYKLSESSRQDDSLKYFQRDAPDVKLRALQQIERSRTVRSCFFSVAQVTAALALLVLWL
jgi:hypothetical protein